MYNRGMKDVKDHPLMEGKRNREAMLKFKEECDALVNLEGVKTFIRDLRLTNEYSYSIAQELKDVASFKSKFGKRWSIPILKDGSNMKEQVAQLVKVFNQDKRDG